MAIFIYLANNSLLDIYVAYLSLCQKLKNLKNVALNALVVKLLCMQLGSQKKFPEGNFLELGCTFLTLLICREFLLLGSIICILLTVDMVTKAAKPLWVKSGDEERAQDRQYYFWLKASDSSAMSLVFTCDSLWLCRQFQQESQTVVGYWLTVKLSIWLPKDTTMRGTSRARWWYFLRIHYPGILFSLIVTHILGLKVESISAF